MKTSIVIAACAASMMTQSSAFTMTSQQTSCRTVSRPDRVVGPLNMFSGSTLDVEEEEDDEKRAQIEQMAKTMGMSVEEYQLGMNSRVRMEEAISSLRVVGGEGGVTVERDGNMPPRHLVVTVTEEGKALGKEKLEKSLVDALKSASEKSKVGRDEAQKDMMKYISENMKKMGAM